MRNLWERASTLGIKTGEAITGGFTVGFDRQIPEETKDLLMHFAYWVEDRYSLPVTLWVDFKYRHYLCTPTGKRVSYRFYWAEFDTFPVFEDYDDIPVIELAVRMEYQSRDKLLEAFTSAICHYYAWLSGLDMNAYEPDEALIHQILQTYQQT